jgi:Eukaryotic aspartyl protease
MERVESTLALNFLPSDLQSRIYSIQVFVGQNQQPVSLSVDTGSSDIWLASSSCSTSACSSSHATLYDPSTSVQTDVSVNLTYL